MGIAEDMRRLRQEVEVARGERQRDGARRRQRVAEIKQETAALREHAATTMRREARQLMAEQQGRLLELAVRVQTVREEARGLVEGYGAALAAQGAVDAAARREGLKEHQGYMEKIREEVEGMRARFQEELAEEREEGTARRREGLLHLQAQVGELRGEVQETLQGFQEEFQMMRGAWSEPGTPLGTQVEMETPRGESLAAPVAPAAPKAVAPRPQPAPRTPESPVKKARAAGEVSDPDDLERIVGIGPSTKKVLYEAGLFYFNDLASMTPEAVTQMLGSLSRFANVEHWIEQARDIVTEGS